MLDECYCQMDACLDPFLDLDTDCPECAVIPPTLATEETTTDLEWKTLFTTFVYIMIIF